MRWVIWWDGDIDDIIVNLKKIILLFFEVEEFSLRLTFSFIHISIRVCDLFRRKFYLYIAYFIKQVIFELLIRRTKYFCHSDFYVDLYWSFFLPTSISARCFMSTQAYLYDHVRAQIFIKLLLKSVLTSYTQYQCFHEGKE